MINCTGVTFILSIKVLFPIILTILTFISLDSIYGQTTPDNDTTILGNATFALNNATNTLAEVASSISTTSPPKTTSNTSLVNATTVVNSIFEGSLPVVFLVVIAAAMVIPLVIDLVLAYTKKSKQDINKENRAPAGMPALYRTLMTFGIILLVGTVIFYLLALITLNINNPTNPVLQSLVDVLKNLSTILGTALATIVAFYFGMRGAESAAEKAETRAREHATDKTPPTVNGTNPADDEEAQPAAEHGGGKGQPPADRGEKEL